ncbi:hypothetical protein GCM10007385_40870 [Tateyamaria omphalii]|uniref:AsmA family protein n=1 Tax=Tateyamaria omphalii TaxID=299262 RepID=UPI0016791867|nr:AsmA family protein [Tateyamaria omphalii]GGX67551.1 hypothetical protein GCM10007385_40870 [Tateyamaria omphalii]
MALRLGQWFGSAPRWAVVAVGLASMCAAAFALSLKLELRDKARASINHELGRLASSDFMLHDTSDVTVRPNFRVVVAKPVFTTKRSGRTEQVLTSDRLEATLAVAPLLVGRSEVATLHVYHPHVLLERDDLANAVWTDIMSTQTDASGSPKPRADIFVTDGFLDFASETSISNLNLSVLRRDAAPGTALRGDFTVGPHRMFVDLQIDDPQDFLSKEGSKGILALSIDTSDHGAANNPSDDTTNTGLFPDLVRGLGHLNIFGPGELLIDGHFAVTPGTIHVSNATFSMGGTTLEGDLSLHTPSDNLILRQLQALQVSADKAISDVMDRIGRNDWASAPVTTHWLEGIELDVDLQGQDVALGGVTFDTVDISLRACDENLLLDIATKGDALGTIDASIALDRDRAVTMVANASNASVSELLHPISLRMQKRLIGIPQLPKGVLDFDLHLKARGQTLGEMFDTLNGSITASMQDGSLSGADVTATLETLANGRQFMTKEKGPLIPAAGRTHFDLIYGQVGISAGSARIARLNIAGDRLDIDMLGEVGLKSGDVSVKGNAQLSMEPSTTGDQIAGHVDLPFGVGGTLFSPLVAAGVPQIEVAATAGPPGDIIQK